MELVPEGRLSRETPSPKESPPSYHGASNFSYSLEGLFSLCLGGKTDYRSPPCPPMNSNASSTVREYFDSLLVYWNRRCGENLFGSNAPRFT